MTQLICFTDLDGTLLNHDDYRYDAALPVIEQLQQAGIPVIPNTSKTRAEVTELRQALGLRDPFVVENGSGIFLEPGDQRFDLSLHQANLKNIDSLMRWQLGVSYNSARQELKALGEQLGEPLLGFGDLDRTELQRLTGLPLAAVEQACDREFSEPFLRPKVTLSAIEDLAQSHQYKILVGNRFCHLLGAGAGKGAAVQWLKQAWCECHPGETVLTLCLGDSPNDLSMLEAADIAIVVPGVKGPHPELSGRQGWHIAPEPGCRGWAKAVSEVMGELTIH